MDISQVIEFGERLEKIWADYIAEVDSNVENIKSEISSIHITKFNYIDDILDPLKAAKEELEYSEKMDKYQSLFHRSCKDDEILSSTEKAIEIIQNFSKTLEEYYTKSEMLTNTFSMIFVSCCNYICIRAIDTVVEYERILKCLINFLYDEKEKNYLYSIGKAIMLRGINEDESDKAFAEAYSILPQYDAAKLYKFIFLCLSKKSRNWDYEVRLKGYGDIDSLFINCYKSFSSLSSGTRQFIVDNCHDSFMYKNNPIFLPHIINEDNPARCDEHEKYVFVDNCMFFGIIRNHFLFMPVRILDFEIIANRATFYLGEKFQEISQKLYDIRKHNNEFILPLDPSSDEYEAEVSKLINKLSQSINDELSDSDLVETEEQLKMFFGEIVWNGFTQYTKTSLKSAAFLMNACKRLTDSADMDYSGICINATSALECEIKRVFFDEFKKYCKTLPNNPVPFPLAKEFRNESMFTMGSLRYALCDYPRDKWNRLGHAQQEKVNDSRELMCNYLMIHFFPNKRCQHPISKFRFGNNVSFLDLCEAIRNNYRNPAAHSEKMSSTQAENCFINVVGKASGEQHIENVKGALKLLYEIIDITSFSK